MPKQLYRGTKFFDRKELARAVREQCELDFKQLWGAPWSALRPRGNQMPEEERRAQLAFAKARRALRGLLAATQPGHVVGPCTAYVNDHRDDLEDLVASREWRLRYRWRQHTADRSGATAWTVDHFARVRRTFGGRGRFLTVRELAIISLLAGAPPRGDSVAACIRSESAAIRAALKRRKLRTPK